MFRSFPSGPCKLIAPKFEEMSEQFENVVFAKVMGDGTRPPFPLATGIVFSRGLRCWQRMIYPSLSLSECGELTLFPSSSTILPRGSKWEKQR
mmetsp:Transcript_2540/g.4417  ORF Transcript_2540/g.4417 Transcript_2540/m.4417 type:complete len:93 (-) Transcript_2540:3088-3366(-)